MSAPSKSEIKPVLFLTVVVCVAVSVLVVTDSFTRDKIKEQEEKALLEAMQGIFPEMTGFELNESIDVYTIFKDSDTIGYAFQAKGTGYGGEIKITVGIESDLDDVTLRGIKVIEPVSETPGLGAKIVEPEFQDQFKGVKQDDIKLSKDGGKIDAITGATISSSAVTNAVREAVEKKVDLLKGGE